MLPSLVPDWWLLLRSLYCDLNFRDEPEYRAAEKQVDDFEPQHPMDAATADLLLSFAREKYSDGDDALNRLDSKREWLFTVVLALLTVGISAPQTLGVEQNFGIWIAYGLLLMAAAILLLARRPMATAAKATILDVHVGLDGITAYDTWHDEEQKQRARIAELGGEPREKLPTRARAADWVARSLHKTCMGMKVTERIMNAQIWAVAVLVTIAVIVLGPALVLAKPISASVGSPAALSSPPQTVPNPASPPWGASAGVAAGVTTLASEVSANPSP